MIAAPSRTTRRPPARGAQLVPRELMALAFIAHAQPISSEHYRLLLGLSGPVARRSLRKLRDLGVLNVWVPSLNGPSWYTLAPVARPHLARFTGRDPESFRVPRGVGRVQLEHHGGSVALYALATRAAARSTRWHLAEWMLEADVRAALGGARKDALVPDAIGVFEQADGSRRALAFEVDTGSERNPSWVASSKFGPYAAMREGGSAVRGCADWAVCVAVTGEHALRRLHRLAAAAWDAEIPEDLVFFATLDELTDHNILGGGWLTPRVAGDDVARLTSASPLPGTSGRYIGRTSPGSRSVLNQDTSGPVVTGSFTSVDV